MKMKQAGLAVALLLSMMQSAEAAPIWCVGKFQKLYISESGELFVLPDWRQDWVQLCNMNADSKGITPTVCGTMFAAAKTAVSTKAVTTIAYWDRESPAPAACNVVPTYQNAPAPGYIMLHGD
ncbi:hypothetical protein [Chitinivorax sp. B]|uniref:hypothetical protein n=1 Tax=Chitinivorax sp. B TaxID=2502235 RepID=UPI0010F8E71E|nr:hypothetical protein [Chitinivorax sp. B]